MAVAQKLKSFLDKHAVAYDVVEHPHTATSSEAAQKAHVSGEKVAKAVVIHHELGYELAVVPSTHRLDLGQLSKLLDKRLGLAGEDEIKGLFPDCDAGAVPPVGAAYGLAVTIDEDLFGLPEVYFEGGDHKRLARVDGTALGTLFKDARRAHFSHHV